MLKTGPVRAADTAYGLSYSRVYAGGGLGVQTPPIGLLTKMHNKENITFLAFLSLFFCNDMAPTWFKGELRPSEARS